MQTHKQSDAHSAHYTIAGLAGRPWEQHLPTLRDAHRSAAHVRGEGYSNISVIEEETGRIVSHDIDEQANRDSDEYSVRLTGMTVWEDHLHTVSAARQSADESRAMGLLDVHVVDDTTGEVLD